MSLSRSWLTAAATLALLVLACGRPSYAIDFPILPSESCPPCYTKNCEVNEFGKPECECSSITEWGEVKPNFFITHVVYTPPGKSSSVKYDIGSSSGSTTSASKSFNFGEKLTISATSTAKSHEQDGVSISDGRSWGSKLTTEVDVKVTNTKSRTVTGAIDLVDHGRDEIWFLLGPTFKVGIDQDKTCTKPAEINWSFAESQEDSKAKFLYLTWLINPESMPDNVRNDLLQWGVTEEDFHEIAKAHPFTTFNLSATHSGKCLNVGGASQADGASVVQSECLAPDKTHQTWRLVPAGGDRVQVLAAHSNKCLAVSGASQTSGARVVQSECRGLSATEQLWRLERTEDAAVFAVKPLHSGKCLDVVGASLDDGAQVVQSTCLGTSQTSQMWFLRPVSAQHPTNASINATTRPGESNRFELIKDGQFTYQSPANPGDPPSIDMRTLKREVVNSSTYVTETNHTMGATVNGTVVFENLFKLGLKAESSMTWTNSTSSKQSDGTSTSHEIKVGQPAFGYTGPVVLNVYHDKLWKTYLFVLDDHRDKMPWRAALPYSVGNWVTYSGLDYKARQAHTAQVGWEPPNVYALWERVNTFGVWAPQVIYKTGDFATYGGKKYKAIQGHQSQPDWAPPNVPALWQLQ